MSEVEKKEEWVKPELLVLIRSKPEERILLACKVLPEGSLGIGPAYYHTACGIEPNCLVACLAPDLVS